MNEYEKNIPTSLHENVDNGILIINTNCEIVEVNPEFLCSNGYKRNDLIGIELSCLFLDGYSEPFTYKLWNEIKKDEKWQGNGWIMQKSNSKRLTWVDIQAIQIDNESYLIVTSMDGLPKRTFLAYHDQLTGLANRHGLTSYFKQLVKDVHLSDEMIALLFIDLDRFKQINDTFGHNCGDILIQQAVKRIKSCLKPNDRLSRLGGDEFICLLPNIQDRKETIIQIEKIINSFSKVFKLKENEVYVTASIGASFFPHDGDNLETLITQADTAMYRAKKIGKNNYALAKSESHASHYEKLLLENMLRKAIKENQLVLYYQPQVNLGTNEIHTVEALIRWNHPDFGVIAPADFIPIAEDSGMILDIDGWVLKTACQQCKEWQNISPVPIRVSVNLSAQQFMQKQLPNKIKQILQESHLSPELLEVEITETMIMYSTELSAKQIEKIRSLGVKVAIDDFGTGFSSFQYLKRFTVDSLKIDRTFVTDIAENRNSKSIMNAMIQLGHDLNLRVIAEGVETKEQLSHLVEPKCDGIQGYYFYKPLQNEEMEALFKTIDYKDSYFLKRFG